MEKNCHRAFSSLSVQSGFLTHRTINKYFWNNICERLYTGYSRQLKRCTQFVPQNLVGGPDIVFILQKRKLYQNLKLTWTHIWKTGTGFSALCILGL